MKSKLALLMPTVLMLSCSAAPQPLVIMVQQEEPVLSGPQQFCDEIRQLIDEGSQGYPSFQGRILESQAIYGNECRGGIVRVVHEAKSPPWASLTNCQIKTIITENSVYHEYTCAGTEWEDPDFLYQMMLDSLRVCFYGQFVFKDSGHGYNESTLKNEENIIILTLFPTSGPRENRLFLEVGFFQKY